MSGKVVLSPLTLTENMGLELEDIMKLLNQRNSAMKLKPQVRHTEEYTEKNNVLNAKSTSHWLKLRWKYQLSCNH